MTPDARIATAALLLDQIIGGEPAEKVLTTWARKSRFAGSKDRAAIRDHVFDALRCRRSYAVLGGAETGRGLMVGHLLAQGRDPAEVFTGGGHAPTPLSAAELKAMQRDPFALNDHPPAVANDMPDWVWPHLTAAFADQAAPVAQALRHRAPVFLRVNTRKTTPSQAQQALAEDGIATAPHPLAATALEVTENPRRVAQSRAYLDGWVELQDAASQAVCAALPLADGMSVLDYCAGGGGKTLALAGRAEARFTAHDAHPARLSDLPERARRAGVRVTISDRPKGRFDLVLCDVPCSGSGAWRRSPEGKWTLDPEGLSGLNTTQDQILETAAGLTADTGVLAYATCSVFRQENQDRVADFLSRHPDWQLAQDHQWTPLDGGDGFYLACLTRR